MAKGEGDTGNDMARQVLSLQLDVCFHDNLMIFKGRLCHIVHFSVLIVLCLPLASEDLFRKHGSVIRVEMPTDVNGESRGKLQH